jgi:dienelactone hydrolase
MLDGWVRRLLAAKVAPGRITLVGFSRGGQITALASSRLASFEEVAISTGKKHGAFYQPLPEWVGPLRAWIEKTSR